MRSSVVHSTFFTCHHRGYLNSPSGLAGVLSQHDSATARLEAATVVIQAVHRGGRSRVSTLVLIERDRCARRLWAQM